MDQLSPLGITFAILIFGMACFLATKLSSRKAYE